MPESRFKFAQPCSPFGGPNGDHVIIIIDAISFNPSNASVVDSVSAFLDHYRGRAWLLPKSLLLATDFDGTIAPIEVDPADVRPLPEAVDALRRLAGRLRRVAVISGRSRPDLLRLLPVDGVGLMGDYGLERPSPEELSALSALAGEIDALVGVTPGAWIERKAGSASVHFRQAPELGPELLREVSAMAARRGLQARMGRRVVEVMPRRADKGASLRRLVEEWDPGAVVYAGDDTGDQACFEYLASLRLPSLAVGVRSPEAEPGLFRLCDLVLDGPAAWARALAQTADWAVAADRADP